MSRNRPSLQSVVALALLGMGGVGLVLVLFSAGIYRSVAHESRAAAVHDLVREQVASQRAALAADQRIAALELAGRPAFDRAWPRDIDALRSLLDEVRATAPPASVLGLRLLDGSLEPVAGVGRAGAGCQAARAAMRAADAGDRTARRCLRDDRPAQSAVFRVEGAQPPAFVEVVGDPVAILARVGGENGLALRIERPGGGVLHESADWSGDEAARADRVSARYLTPSRGDEPVFAIRAAASVGLLNRQLGDARDFVLIAAGIVVGLALLAALVGLRRMMRPLHALQSAAEAVSRDRGIDECPHVPEAGPPEIATPIRSFNAMVERVRALIRELESEVAQRRDAEATAHRERELAESHAHSASQAREFSQATLEAVVDAVIATDVEANVEYMNPVAETLVGVSEGQAVGRPIGEVVPLYSRDGARDRTELVHECLHRPRTAGVRRIGRLGRPDSDPLDDGAARYVDYAVVAMQDRDERTVGTVLIFHDVTEAQRLTDRLRHQATHDALTGLINRYEFEDRLQRVLDATRDGNAEAVLCYLDLDQFKLVNDTCGHVAGDELLRQLSLLLTRRLGDRGTLGRLGGDEFGLLIHPCAVSEARALAEELRVAIQQFRFVWNERIFGIGVSIGVVAIDQTSTGTEDLLSAADTACYMAKDSGRNRIQVYQPDDAALQERRAEMHWVSEIKRALEEDRLVLYCQDIVETRCPEPVRHYEILVRMRDDNGQLWQPGSFLPAAERYNLAPELDSWVVRRALAWIGESEVPADALYSINLSGRSLAADGFLDAVVAALDEFGVSPSNVCFEVTETAAISNLAYARGFMDHLRARGCRFSLDDFGSGLSSFNYLRSLPVDFLKIDGVFVRDIIDNPVHQAIVGSINEVGHAMAMHTIAEFAESTEVIECLRGIGVDFVQGYGYGRPRPLTPALPAAGRVRRAGRTGRD